VPKARNDRQEGSKTLGHILPQPYMNTWLQIEEWNPGFMANLEEVSREIRDLRYTTKGAMIRELPHMRDEVAQIGDLLRYRVLREYLVPRHPV